MTEKFVSQTKQSRVLVLGVAVLLTMLLALAIFFPRNRSEMSRVPGIRIDTDAGRRMVANAALEKGSFKTLSKMGRGQLPAAELRQPPEALTLDQVLRALALIPSLVPGDETDARELALVQRWASFEPESACDYAYHAVLDGADESLLREVVSAWARVDPASASRWASKLRSPLLRDISVSTVYGIWALTDRAAAVSSLRFFPGSSARSSAWSGMAGLSVRNPKATLAWVMKLPGPLRERVLQQVFGFWMRRDPQAAAEWLASQTVEVQLPLVGRLASEWTRKDPMAALYWSRAAATGPLTGLQLKPGPVQRRAMEAALGSFVNSDPEGAAAWMMSGPGRPYFAQRAASISSSWTAIDPVAAASWALSLPPGRERDGALAAVASTWTRSDPSEALRWAQGNRRASDRNLALASFAITLAGTDPESAAYWSSQILDRPLREATLAQVVSQWKNINSGAAAQFVQMSNEAAFLRKKP
jgi:hypothetical protein